MEQATRLDLPLLLPDVKDVQDDCVERLVRLLEQRDGVSRVHVVRVGEPLPPGEPAAHDPSRGTPAPAGTSPAGAALATEPQLCLHYDPERLPLAQVVALARAAGAGVTERFAHAVIEFRAVTTEDGGRRIEDDLRTLPGVTAASVNLAGQVARVEFDRRATDETKIRSALSEAGARVTPADEAPGSVGPPEERGWYARNRELAWSLTSGALLAVAWILSRTSAPPLVPIAL